MKILQHNIGSSSTLVSGLNVDLPKRVVFPNPGGMTGRVAGVCRDGDNFVKPLCGARALSGA